MPRAERRGRTRAARRPRLRVPSLKLVALRANRRTTTRRRLKVVGLFAGIGGIELGLHRAGHQATLLCEVDPGARAVLADRFPCQDLSQAGMTAGITGARSGLVGEAIRLLQRKRVPLVLLENVPFMLQLGGGRALEV